MKKIILVAILIMTGNLIAGNPALTPPTYQPVESFQDELPQVGVADELSAALMNCIENCDLEEDFEGCAKDKCALPAQDWGASMPIGDMETDETE